MFKVAPLVAFAVAVLAQVISVIALPRTLGFTSLPATVVCLATFDFSLFICARLLQGGVNLGLLIPATSACVPLAGIAVGIFIYHEPAVLARIVLLCFACGLVAIAAAL